MTTTDVDNDDEIVATREFDPHYLIQGAKMEAKLRREIEQLKGQRDEALAESMRLQDLEGKLTVEWRHEPSGAIHRTREGAELARERWNSLRQDADPATPYAAPGVGIEWRYVTEWAE